jgi:acetyl esterase/lipase
MKRLATLLIVLAVVTLWPAGAAAQGPGGPKPVPAEANAIPLYAGVAPGSENATQVEVWESMGGSDSRIVRNVTRPTLTPFLPLAGQAPGAAVIVAPGGAFLMLSIDSEGYQAAKWLADHGVAAFVLKYRLTRTAGDPQEFMKELRAFASAINKPGGRIPETPPETLADATAAIALVRSRAKDWGIDPARVGFAGFSAGAITALSVGLLADASQRPSFIAPIYPPMQHQAVPADAPPMFVGIAADDGLLGGAQMDLVRDWIAARRPIEFHLFERGGHGFGMRVQGATTDHWIQEFLWWMQARGYLGTQARTGNPR